MSAVTYRVAARNITMTTFWYALGLAAYGAVIIAFYPTVRDSSEQFQNLLDTVPSTLLEAFGVDPEANFAAYSVYIGARFLNLIWAIIAGIYVIMAGTAVVAQEIEKGTVELWLSLPAERWKLLLPKIGSLLGGCIALVLATIGVVGLGGVAVDADDLTLSGMLAMAIVLLAFIVAVGGYSICLSPLFNQRSKAAGIAAAITLGSYLLNVISGLSESWNWLRYFSIFTAYNPQKALETGHVPPGETAILILIGLLATAAGIALFQRRDVVL